MSPGTDRPHKSFSVGLTGGIGSGKSTVARLFGELGVAVIDSDAISHQLTQAGGAAIPIIQSSFGAEYLDAAGALDRAKMRQLVFADPAAKIRLEAILHPAIHARMLAMAQDVTSPYLLLIVPLLFEAANYRELVQRTLVVDCPEHTQLARTMQRSHLDEAAVRAIMAQQLPRQTRLQLADDIVHNDASLADLREQVARLHQLYLSLSSESTCHPSADRPKRLTP